MVTVFLLTTKDLLTLKIIGYCDTVLVTLLPVPEGVIATADYCT